MFVVGSTASGKSNWAMQLAKKHNGIIVNADSVQFYQGLEIGSASPTLEEKKQVPHHLYNYIEAPQEMTAGQFVRDFYSLLKELSLQKEIRPLFVVGGTGFYLQSLEKGMYDVPEVSSELKAQIEHEIQQHGAEKAYQELIEFDPETKVHPNDAYRIGRALEVKRAFGKKMSELHAEYKSSSQNQFKNYLKNPYLKIGIWNEKEVLLEKVQVRTQYMLQNGMIEEVKTFMAQGFSSWAPLSSVGYFEVKEMLEGRLAFELLESQIITSTMQLIKKQKTWFKRDQSILWSDGEKQKILHVENLLDQFLIHSVECSI